MLGPVRSPRRIVTVAALAVATGVVTGACVRRPSFTMLSCAMYPTLKPGYHVRVEEPPRALRRADIVVYRPPPAERLRANDTRVSRIVGLPGEHIDSQSGDVRINGRPLAEPYRGANDAEVKVPPTDIPDGSYFLLGDNRLNSADSRGFGPLPRSDIVARGTKIVRGRPKAHAPDCRAP